MKLTDSTPLSYGPLASFDVFMEGYRKAQSTGEDLVLLNALSKSNQWRHNFDFVNELYRLRSTIIVTSPSMKIVYASSSISSMTGYEVGEIIGKTPQLFQGVKTNIVSRQRIRQAVSERKSFEETLINYRKNGSTYNCNIKGIPVYNRNNEVVNFIAFEKEM